MQNFKLRVSSLCYRLQNLKYIHILIKTSCYVVLVCALYRPVVSLQFYAHITNSGPSKPHTYQLHTHLTSEIVLQCPCLLKENVTIVTCQLEMLMQLTAPEHPNNSSHILRIKHTRKQYVPGASLFFSMPGTRLDSIVVLLSEPHTSELNSNCMYICCTFFCTLI